MAYRIISTPSGYQLANVDNGDLARTTGCDVYFAPSRESAEEAVAYLDQPRAPGAKRAGSHRMKSIFGTI